MTISLKLFNTGPLQVNTYVVIDEASKEAMIVDLGGDFDEIMEFINSEGASLKFIINTHGHFDHILGEKYAQEMANVKVLAHKNDEELIKNLSHSLMMFGLPMSDPPELSEFIDENSELYLGDNKIKVIHTPGHTQGGVCFLIGNMLFSGDTLFQGSIGRCDLPGGDFQQLVPSIRTKLFPLPPETMVYPGHGGFTTLAYEREHNGFL